MDKISLGPGGHWQVTPLMGLCTELAGREEGSKKIRAKPFLV